MGSKVRVAAVQLCSDANTSLNVERAIELVRRACEEGAAYIQVPEYFNYVGSATRNLEVCEPIPGPTTARMAEVARSHQAVVHLGSILEQSATPGKCYNTSVIINASGEIIATYRKSHLFDVDVPGEVFFRESDAIERGNQLAVVQLPDFTLGMSICFDLRFAAMYRTMALQGATVFAIPAAFAVPTGRAHWEVLVRARAIENHAFVIAAAQVGTTAEGIASYGHSMIVGPWGEILAESRGDTADVLIADIDIGEVARRRAQIGVLRDDESV